MTTNFLACKEKSTGTESDGELRALKDVSRELRRYINDQDCSQKEAVERLGVLLTADGDDLPSPLTVGLLNPGYEFICFGCGQKWQHRRTRTTGLCVVCVGFRRPIQRFINNHTLTKDAILERMKKDF